ncbi:MFS transporter [uncultured Clostridium sp.]|uniref:MFS transporter n=1 Tax=uncultured Clostridium sp. TaxID=59620 RepID=UPI002634B354|nr:MFS transporter [uncultured Clostridium sp.]
METTEKKTHVRFIVIALLFLAVTINYMDRVNFAVSTPAIQKQFGFSIEQMGMISFVWALVYAIFNFPGGLIVDKLGLRKAASFALGWWSIFTILTAFAYSFMSWILIRGLMGAGEAPLWPINAKTTRPWSPEGKESTAYTIPASGQFIGPAFGSILSGWIVVKFGWEWTFIIFGILGLIWVPIWYTMVRDNPKDHPLVNERELRYIQGVSNVYSFDEKQIDKEGVIASLKLIFKTRNGIGILLNYLTFGYVLFTFLNWLPSFMYYTFHLSIIKSATWSSISYSAGFFGFLVSGPVNDFLVRKYGRIKGRKIGAGIPILLTVVFMCLSIVSSKAGLIPLTVGLFAASMFFMTFSSGAWSLNAVDLSRNKHESAFVYGVYNGILNLMGAANSLILTFIAEKLGFISAFASAIIFLIIFLIGLIFIIKDKNKGI